MDDPRTRFVASRNAAFSRLIDLGEVLNALQARHEADPTNTAVLDDIGRIADRLRQILDDFPAPPRGTPRR